MTRSRHSRVAFTASLFFIVSSAVVLAQAPVPDVLLTAQRVYIYAGPGLDRELVDHFAKEVAKRDRFEVVSTRDQADLLFGLHAMSEDATFVVPVQGVGAVVFDETSVRAYRLTITDPVTSAIVWTDVRKIRVRKNGAVARLAKDLHERLAKEPPPSVVQSWDFTGIQKVVPPRASLSLETWRSQDPTDPERIIPVGMGAFSCEQWLAARGSTPEDVMWDVVNGVMVSWI